MTKATHKKTRVDIMKSQKRQQKKAYGLGRQNLTGYTDVAGGFTTMHQVSSASSGGSNQTAPINAVGAVNFMDPVAFWMHEELLYPTSPDNTIDLGETGAYTSHWIWSASGSEILNIIANASHSGQILFIESTATRTPVVKSYDASTNPTGNILTLDGEEFTFPSNKTIVLFMFSSIDNFWHQVSNPAAGGATTALDNLTTTSINQDLIPSDTSKNLGSAAKPWFNAHVENLIMEGTTHSGATFTEDKFIRVYIDAESGYRWLQYYNS